MARAGIHLTGHQLAGAVATVGIRAFSAAQNAVKVLLALGGGIVVNQGVDAAAHAAHADAEEVSKIGRLCARTVGEEQVVHNQEDVGGPKADDEDAEHGGGQEQSPRLLAPVRHRGGAEASDDGRVADCGNDQRHKKEDGGEGGEIVRVKAMQQGLVEDVVARGDVEPRNLGGLLFEEEGHHPHDGHHPDDHAGEVGSAQSAPGQGLDGVHHGQEPVNAYDCHEHDGGVHVTIKRCGGEATHSGPELPIGAGEVVADLEGEHGHEEDIGHGQVQHVHHGRLLDLHPKDKHSDGQDVQGKADYEHKRVHGGYEERQPGAGQISGGVLGDEGRRRRQRRR